MGAASKRRVLVSESIGVMPEVAEHNVNSAAGGRESPLEEGVRAQGWILNAERGMTWG